MVAELAGYRKKCGGRFHVARKVSPIQKKQADTIISLCAPLASGFTIKPGGQIFVARLPDARFRRPSLLKKRPQLRGIRLDFRRAMSIPGQSLKRDQGSG